MNTPSISGSGRVLLALLSAAAPLAGCFSDRVPITDPPVQASCEGTPEPGVVRIRDFAFEPATLQVEPGTTVVWINCGAVAHTSTADTDTWDSGLLSTEMTFSRRFEQAGDFAYHCEPHPFMQGAVVVE